MALPDYPIAQRSQLPKELDLCLLSKPPSRFEATQPTFIAADAQTRECLESLRLNDEIKTIEGRFFRLGDQNNVLSGIDLMHYVQAKGCKVRVTGENIEKQAPFFKVEFSGGFID